MNVWRINPLRILAFFLILQLQTGIAAKVEAHGEVVNLTADNFDEMINDPLNGLWLIKFYTPWCGHCKKLSPVLDKVAVYLKGTMAIGKVDCTSHKHLCKRFDVKGYPTLKVYRDGDFFDYPSERHADAIIEFAEKMSKNPVSVVTSLQDALENVVGNSKDGVGFVAYDPESANGDAETVEEMLQSSTTLQVFGQIARKMQATAHFGLLEPTAAEEAIIEFGVGNKPFIIKIEKNERPVEYDIAEPTSPTFLDFVKDQNRGLVTALGVHNFRNLGNAGKPLAIAVVNPSNEAKTESFLSDVRKFVRNNVDGITSQYVFCWMDGKKWEKFLQQFDIEYGNLPEFFVLDVPAKQYWQNATVSSLSIEDFMSQVESGQIEKRKQAPKQNTGILYILKQNFIHQPWLMILFVVVFLLLLYLYIVRYDENEKAKELALQIQKESKKEK